MPIRFRCRSCQQLLSVASRKAGEAVTCPKCGTALRVPVPESAAPGTETPPTAGTAAPGTDPQATRVEVPQIPAPAPRAPAPPPTIADDILPRVGDLGPDPPQLRPRTAAPSAPARGPDAAPPAAAPVPDKPHRPVAPAAPQAGRGPAPRPAPVSRPRPADADAPTFEFKKRDTELEEMDLTPMVDVTFLLLIFFMITASFQVQKSIEVPRPDQDKKGAAQSQMTLEDLLDSSIKIDVDAKNTIVVDDEPLPRPEELVETLARKMRTESKTEVILRVDPGAFWETTVTVCDACNAVGMQKIRMAAWEEGGGR